MFTIEICGGYCGSLGSLTAFRKIELPCPPFRGLEIRLDGQYLIVEHSNDGDFPSISWNCEKREWACHVEDVGDYHFRGYSRISQIVKWYEKHGWTVSDFEDYRRQD